MSATVTTSAQLNRDLEEITSARTLRHVARSLVDLATFPDMGRLADSPTLTSRFGHDVRTLVCGSYLLVYRHEGATVAALALYPARLVR